MSESERETIPQQLRAARRAKGVELDDAHRKIGVSLPVLQGLEAGKYDVVEPVFSRMAFGAYVDYLGLDKDALFAQYDALQGPATRSVVVAEPAAAAAPASESGPVLDGGAVRMVALAAGALVLLLIIISLLDGDDAPAVVDQPARAAVEVPVAQKSVPSTAKSAAPTAARSASAVPERSAALAPADTMPEIPAALEEVAVGDVEPVLQEQADEGGAAVQSAGGVAAAATNSATETSAVEAVADSLPAPVAEAPSGETVAVPDEAVLRAAVGAEQTPVVSATPALDEGLVAAAEEVVAAAEVAAPTLAQTAASAGVENGLLLLEVEAVDSTWVQVNWDESGYFQGIVPRGESRRWQAKDSFRVHSGRAHGLRYTFQGELLGDGALGEATRVLRFLATAEGVSLLGSDLKPLETAAQP